MTTQPCSMVSRDPSNPWRVYLFSRAKQVTIVAVALSIRFGALVTGLMPFCRVRVMNRARLGPGPDAVLCLRPAGEGGEDARGIQEIRHARQRRRSRGRRDHRCSLRRDRLV